MKKIVRKIFDWMVGYLVVFEYASAIDDDISIGEGARRLRFLGMSQDHIAVACRDFYGQQKASTYLPPDLMDLARQYIGQDSIAIDSQDTFSYTCSEVIETTDDQAVYDNLLTGYEMFDTEEALVLIAQIITLWVRKTASFQLASVVECGFFMTDDDEVPWTIRMLNNSNQLIVSMDMFNETDMLWPKHAVVLSPLSVSDENYLHSLES
ncbi:MAG: hypothetical protein PHT88_03620 [Candidatus Moranbacteria bacterium]|nr:hypothetical protein [Candidatus Moranbacteria bacterium]